jgi:hypothetical protein
MLLTCFALLNYSADPLTLLTLLTFLYYTAGANSRCVVMNVKAGGPAFLQVSDEPTNLYKPYKPVSINPVNPASLSNLESLQARRTPKAYTRSW